MTRSSLLLLAGMIAALAAPALAAERMPQMPPDQMTAEQKTVADRIMATRHTLTGPYHVWLRSPEMADRFQAVGEYLRFRPDLPPQMRELAIMVTAREWNSQFEWNAHYRDAVATGNRPEQLAAIAEGQRPDGMNADQIMIYDFSRAMHRDHGKVSDALFDAVRTRFGDTGIVDLIGLNAYYVFAAMTINATDIPPQVRAESTPPLLKPLP